MKNIWVITPSDSSEPDIFEQSWKYDLKNGTIAIGWSELGDISKLSREELEKKYSNTYKESPGKGCSMLWKFYHDVSIGDTILVRRGRKNLIATGEVTRTAYFDNKKGKERVDRGEDSYSSFIDVKWQEVQKTYDRIVFAMDTLYSIPEERYKVLVYGNIDEQVMCEGDEEIEDRNEFVLEKYLEDFIISNFDNIFSGELEIHKEEGVIGQQYTTSGRDRIDILAREPKTKAYVVIELKKGKAADHVVGQLLRYMGWVKENLAKNGEIVKGMIILKEKDERLDYALKAIPQAQIKVKRYKVNFGLYD